MLQEVDEGCMLLFSIPAPLLYGGNVSTAFVEIKMLLHPLINRKW